MPRPPRSRGGLWKCRGQRGCRGRLRRSSTTRKPGTRRRKRADDPWGPWCIRPGGGASGSRRRGRGRRGPAPCAWAYWVKWRLDERRGSAPVRVRFTVGSGRGSGGGLPGPRSLAARGPRHSCTEIGRAGMSTPEAWVQGGPRRSPSRTRPHLQRGKAGPPDQRCRSGSVSQVRQDGGAAFRNASGARVGGAGALPGPMLRGTPSRWRTSSGHERPRIADCRHRGPGRAPAPPARPSVIRTNARVAGRPGRS